MRVLRGHPRGWSGATPDGAAVAIGVFDGVHRGHQKVLADMAKRADEAGGIPRVVITFDEHPLRVVAPDAAPRMLTSEEQRLELFDEQGVDVVALLPFRQIRDLSPDEFIDGVLVEAFSAALVAAGSDFRFGRDRAGDADLLVAAGATHDFEVDVVRLLEEHGHPLSSTEIRIMVAAGRVEEASEALGRRFELRGEVVHGDERGTQIGFPTANLNVDPELAVPGHGVYVAQVPVDRVHAAAVNVGVRPTFGQDVEVVEAYLLDFEGDLYGREIAVQFHSRIRDEQAFDSVGALVEQIRADVSEVRRRLGSTEPS